MTFESLLAVMNRRCDDLTAVRTLRATVPPPVRRPPNGMVVGLVVGLVLLLAVAPAAVVGATGAGVDPGTWGTSNDLQEESGSDFNVTITNTSSPVTAGDTLRITLNVTNEGETADTQEIDIAIGDAVESTQKRTLAAGETKLVTLEWETSVGDIGEYVTTGESEDAEDSVVTVVERADGDGSGGLGWGLSALIVLLAIILLVLVIGIAYQYHQSRTESR